MGLFSRKKKEPQLPDNLFDRIGSAAAAIQYVLHKNGIAKLPPDPDICIWENFGFIIAMLKESGIIHSADAFRLTLKMKDLYSGDPIKSSDSFVWLIHSHRFYSRQVTLMLNKSHELPDVIVYNILHPSNSRKEFEDIRFTDIDFFVIQEVWAYISDIMGHYFYRKDEDISRLPLGV